MATKTTPNLSPRDPEPASVIPAGRSGETLSCRKCGSPTPSMRARYCDACRPNKYRARGVVVGGRRFSSKKEAARHGALCGMAEAGLISKLHCQPRFPIVVNGDLVCVYVADFSYIDQFGRLVIEDVKSKYTAKNPVYRLKKKLMQAANNIVVKEYW